MKKMFALVSACALALSLAACSTGGSSSGSAQKPNNNNKDRKSVV